MAFYPVDVRERAIQRVTREYNGADNARFFLIEAGSGKHASKKARRSLAALNAIAAAIIIAAFVKNAPSQDNTRTTGFVTGVRN